MTLEKLGGGGVIVEAEGPAGEAGAVADTWTTVASLNTGRQFLASASGGNGKVYAIGGESDNSPSSTVEQYDPANDTWTTVASLNTAKQRLAAASDNNGKVYAIGGDETNAGSGVVATVEQYDPANDTWTTVASLSTARRDLGAASDNNGKIYAIGGKDSNFNTLSSVEQYDPANDTWTTVTSTSTGRFRLSAASDANGRVYAIGGDGTESLVEQYDPANDTWTTVASLNTGRQFLASASGGNGKVYAIGGDGTESLVEQYDPANDTWTTVASLNTGRARLGAASDANGRVYAIGGEESSNSESAVVEQLTFKPKFNDVYTATGDTLVGIDDPNGILLNRATGREQTGDSLIAQSGETIAAFTDSQARIYRTEET